MNTKSKLLTVVASAGVLGAGWMLGTANGHTLAPTTTGAAQQTTTSQTSTSTAATSPGSTSSPDVTTSSPSGTSGTFTGQTATNRYGSVTVAVTLTSGKITDVSATYTVNEPKSNQYVQRALPTLRSRVVAANSASVATVSGSTYTSQSYLTSLQSALDQAGR